MSKFSCPPNAFIIVTFMKGFVFTFDTEKVRKISFSDIFFYYHAIPLNRGKRPQKDCHKSSTDLSSSGPGLEKRKKKQIILDTKKNENKAFIKISLTLNKINT